MKLLPDTFSKKIRKYIEWNRYCELQNLLENDSLIVREKISDQDVVRRIEVLEEFENNYGFVYFGEKQWLRELQEKEASFTYSDWVLFELENQVFRKKFVFDDAKGIGKCWMVRTDNLDWLEPLATMLRPL